MSTKSETSHRSRKTPSPGFIERMSNTSGFVILAPKSEEAIQSQAHAIERGFLKLVSQDVQRNLKWLIEATTEGTVVLRARSDIPTPLTFAEFQEHISKATLP